MSRRLLVDASAAEVAGFLAGTDGINGDPICLQCLKWDHRLLVFHVVPAQQQHPAFQIRHLFAVFLLIGFCVCLRESVCVKPTNLNSGKGRDNEN